MKKINLNTVLVLIGAIGVFFGQSCINGVIAGDVPDNMALHGAASVSSVHEMGAELNAGKLNDGWYYDETTTHVWLGGLSDYIDQATGTQFPHQDSWWAQIDLGAVKEVGAVAFGSDILGRTPKDFTIQMSADGICRTRPDLLG